MKASEQRVMPIIILQSGSMSKADIARLRANGLCVVESKMPSAVRFMDAPYTENYSVQERAAIALARALLQTGTIGNCTHKQAIGMMYADILLSGDPLKQVAYVEKTTP